MLVASVIAAGFILSIGTKLKMQVSHTYYEEFKWKKEILLPLGDALLTYWLIFELDNVYQLSLLLIGFPFYISEECVFNQANHWQWMDSISGT